MAYREVLTEAKRLPLGEQLRLVEELLHAMRQSTKRSVPPRRKRIVPFTQLRGALKLEGALPTDDEIEDAYTGYLMEKYL